MANGFSPPSLKVGDYVLIFEEGEKGEEYEEMARKELRETPEVVSDAITALKSLLRGEHTILRHHLRQCRILIWLLIVLLFHDALS
jgi:hypothetical protein